MASITYSGVVESFNLISQGVALGYGMSVIPDGGGPKIDFGGQYLGGENYKKGDKVTFYGIKMSSGEMRYSLYEM